MNKVEMADRLSARTGMSKAAARDAVDSVFATIGEALANDDEVRIAGFGTFAARTRPARTGRNSRTGAGARSNYVRDCLTIKGFTFIEVRESESDGQS